MDILSFMLGKAAGGGGGGGGDITVEQLNVSSNNTYTAPSGKAYSPVVVNVPNTYAQSDEGKVVSNGALVAQTSDTVTQNGTVDTTLINSLTVNVAGGGGGGPLAWLGQEAEVVKTYDQIKVYLKDTDYATWTPSTTASIIYAPQTLTDFVLADMDQYDYFVRQRFHCVPVHVAGATLASTIAQTISEYITPCYLRPASNSTDYTTGVFTKYSVELNPLYAWTNAYYNSAGALTITDGTLTGPAIAQTAPTVTLSGSGTSRTATIKTTQIQARCSNTQFSTTRAPEIDKDNTFFVIAVDIIRCKRCNLYSGLWADVVDIYNNPLT